MEDVIIDNTTAKKKKKKIIVALLLVSIISVLSFFFIKYKKSNMDGTSISGYILGNGIEPGLTEEEIRALLNKRVDESKVAFSIYTEPTFKGKKGTIMFANPRYSAHNIDLVVTYKGKEIIRTEKIKPDQYIEDIKLIGKDTQTHTQNVEVSGTVKNKDGVAPEGKIEVELPTALSFSVDQKGVFQGADYEVTNHSSVPVVVSVQSFSDTTPNEGEGITVKKASELSDPANAKRSTVVLGLLGTPVLGEGQTGIDLSAISKGGDDILEVDSGGNKGIITLVGAAGKKEDGAGIDAKGAQDTFNLVFKVRAKTN